MPSAGESSTPIAIIGIGCRFPGGADGPASFWRLLRDGVDAISEIPAERWDVDRFYDPDPGRAGKHPTRHGGFIRDVDRFDAAFFGISPREAARMDPQQRLLLEVAWEALEDAAQPIDRTTRSNTGVFVGVSNLDYDDVQEMLDDLAEIDTHTATGTSCSIVANRISHALNFGGPSLAVDTACSSSLVALHLACASLRSGECDRALAGGVNLMLNPEVYVAFSRLAMLSPDGRCRAFDARGSGFARAEGVGVVVLKPLERALAEADPIYAVVRGTGVNQDGRTPGLTMPDRAAQESLVREVCARAGVDPGRVTYVETHGPGTPVGDPIEAHALSGALCSDRRPEDALVLGSVKTNIGHLEPAAGIAGVIKVALMIAHRSIPKNLHFERPNPAIPFEELRLRVPRAFEPWPDHRPVIAGVDAFGFGGTNAHALLAAPAEPHQATGTHAAATQTRPELVVISARSETALTAYAAACRDHARGGRWRSRSLRDVARTAARRRAHHPHRLAVVAASEHDLAERLDAFCRGEACFGVVPGKARGGDGCRIAFVYSGQGPQWWAMGRELLADEPVFRDAIARCDRLLRAHADWSLLEELQADERDSRMHQPAIAQPAIFCLQMALTALWASWGVEPDAVVGHSVGEAASAWAGGVLSLEDALRVIFQRGRCMQLVPATGRMLAVGLDEAAAREHLAAHDGRVEIAAMNGPESLTLAGDAEALAAIEEALQSRDVFCRPLKVSYAFHSHHMDVVQDEVQRSLDRLRTQEARIRTYSTVSGRPVGAGDFGAGYWWRNVRQPVRFAEAIAGLAADGCDVFLEVGPHPVLSGPLSECLLRAGRRAAVLHSLRRGRPERAEMLASLAAVYGLGRSVRWEGLFPEPGVAAPFPGYTWDHESHWHQTAECREFLRGSPGGPLLGRRLSAPTPTWESRLDSHAVPFLHDHRVNGDALLPGTASVELALAAAATAGQEAPVLEGLQLHKAVFLSREHDVLLQTRYDPDECSFSVHSRLDTETSAWQLNASGTVLPSLGSPCEPTDLGVLRQRFSGTGSIAGYYDELRSYGFDYGPAFQGLSRLFSGENEWLGEVVLPPSVLKDIARYRFHPAALDACLQVMGRAAPLAPGCTYLPVAFKRVRVLDRPRPRMWSHVHHVRTVGASTLGSVRILAEDGTLIAEIEDFEAKTLQDRARPDPAAAARLLYAYRWMRTPRSAAPSIAQAPPSLEAVAAAVRAGAGSTGPAADEPEIAEACGAYVVDALARMGWQAVPGTAFDPRQQFSSLGITETHDRLLAWYLEMLREDGYLAREEGRWTVRRRLEAQDTRRRFEALLEKYPERLAELTILDRCGRRLPDILRGQVDPATLLFPKGDLSLVEHLAQDSPHGRGLGRLLARTVAELLDRLPENGAWRLLEIGAGVGGRTAHIAPWLSGTGARYLVSDPSSELLAHAAQKLRELPFVEYAPLDIDEDPRAQGFGERAFDVVVAADALSATTDLRRTLGHVARLLAPGGVLILSETVAPARWLGLSLALMPAWWRFAETESRRSHACVPADTWQRLLRESGFAEVQTLGVPRDADPDTAALMLARAPLAADRPDGSRSAAASPDDCSGRWLIFADGGGAGARLAARLAARGGEPCLVARGEVFQSTGGRCYRMRPDSRDDMRLLFETALADGGAGGWRGVVHLWGLDLPATDALDEPVLRGQVPATCMSVVSLLQELIAHEAVTSPRVWLVTRGAALGLEPGAADVAVAQAPLWGLGRVIMNEHPRVHCKLVDLDPNGTADDPEGAGALLEELLADDAEDEVALRGAWRHLHRFERTSLDVRWDGSSGRSGDAGFRLECVPRGVLDNLRLRESGRVAPGDGEIEIAVRAAGLNFRDVMQVLSLLPGATEESPPLGIECAGVVTRVGPGVSAFRPGDRVLAFAANCLASHVTVSEHMATPMPDRLSFEAGATMPAAFVTAHYGLVQEAGLRAGERVLVHSASGGVGLAAVQVAREVGACVIATAGTPQKRDFLRRLGIEHVLDSRSLAFADQVRELTGGEGVDVVLNSLAGEAIPKGLSVLRNKGRFVELGVRDMLQNRRLGMSLFRNNLSFVYVDFGRVRAEQPALVAETLRTVMSGWEAGAYTALPYRVFPISMAREAFRHMAQARHVGKIVLSLEDRTLRVAPRRDTAGRLKSDATYLVSGGLGGFGLLVARWIVEQGARRLVLMGRSGAATEAARTALRALEDAGATVVVARGDVTREDDVARVLADVRRRLPPLRGVVHAAMVLDDCTLPNLDGERLNRVLFPKALGARHLARLARAEPLDFFVLFSSCSAILGLPGQANYDAANTLLDALAWRLRALGVPATSVNWGYLGKVGYAASHADVAARFEKLGVPSVSPEAALEALGQILDRGPTQLSVLNIDWAAFLGQSPTSRASPRFADFAVRTRGGGDSGPGGADATTLRRALAALDAGAALIAVESALRDQIAKVAGANASTLDVHAGLTDLGFDSLMAVELRNWAESTLGVPLRTMEVMRGPTIRQLAQSLLASVNSV